MKMWKYDWKSILTDRKVLVTLLAMAFIPILYAGIMLSSMWDPFNRTKNIDVAVINEDKPAKMNDSELTIGNDLVKELKKNKDMNWHFVSKKQAENGYEKNEYYMVVTIPKDFSENATTAMDKNPKKMQLHYEINPGRNYFIESITKKATDNINRSISEKVTESYIKVMFETMKSIGDGFQEGSDGATKIADGTKKTVDGNEKITNNLKKLSNSTLSFRNGANDLNVGLGKYIEGVSTIATGGNDLQNGLKAYTQGVAQVDNGASQLQNGVTQLTSKQGSLLTGTESIVSGSQNLQSGIDQVTSGGASLESGLNTLSSKANELENGISTINNGQQSLTTGIQNASKGSASLLTNLQTLEKAIPTSTNAEQLTNGLNSITEISAQIDQAIQQNDLQTAKELSSKLSTLTSSVNPNAVNAVNGLSQLSSSVNSLTEGANTLNAGLQSAADSSQKLSDGTALIANAVPQLTKGIESAASGSENLNNGLSQLQTGSLTLTTGMQNLQSGITQYTGGVTSIQQGIGKLAEGSNTLQSKSDAVVTGAEQLANGAQQLAANSNALKTGSQQLANGAGSIQDGVSALATGSSNLGEGLQSIKSGSEKLASKFEDGAEKINDEQLSNANIDMIAEPTTLKLKKTSDVPNYAHALAPNFLSLGLYIMAMAFNMIFPIGIAMTPAVSGRDWWFSKMTIAIAFATVGTVILDLIAIYGLKLQIAHIGLFILISIIGSWTYMFFVMMLNITIGNPGKFLAMIGLVFQLASSGAMFPKELTSPFFESVNPYIPMTYVIYGFRQAISSAEGMDVYWNSIAILLICMAVFNIILLLVFHLKFKKQVQAKEKNVAIS